MEIPKGKKVSQLPISHFKRLVKQKGFDTISKSLTTLQVLNKNRNKPLSAWANKMQKSLARWHKGPSFSIKKVSKKNPCNVSPKRNTITEKLYPYVIFLYKLGKSKAFKGEYITGLKRTKLTVDLSPAYSKKMVLNALRYRGLIRPDLKDEDFSIKSDQFIFKVYHKNNPEFELRRED